MSDKDTITFSKDQFQQFLDKLAEASQQRMNPLEEKKYKEEMEREKRRLAMQMESARIEIEKTNRRKYGCTHTRDKEGNSAPRGQGTWTTSGQVHGDDTITLICMRCGTDWHFKGSPNERDLAVNGPHGLLGMAPPDESRVINTTVD